MRPAALFRLLVVVMAAAALLVAPAAAQAAPSGDVANPADILVGKWVGSFHGYLNGAYVEGQEKIVVTSARGNAAVGTWQYRMASSDPWSAPQPVQFLVSVGHTGMVHVRGADSAGTYDGHMASRNRLVLDYMGSMPNLQTFQFNLRRK